jgi:hypothetical protein
VTFRQLIGTMRALAKSDPDALDREVILRVGVPNGDDDEDIYVGGLRSAVVDSGCADEDALTLDADQESEDE